MDHQNFFKTDYTPYVVKWGRLTNIIGAVFLFIPCIVLSIMATTSGERWGWHW